MDISFLQGDQIGQFFANWATFKSPWRFFTGLSSPKMVIFGFLGNFHTFLKNWTFKFNHVITTFMLLTIMVLDIKNQMCWFASIKKLQIVSCVALAITFEFLALYFISSKQLYLLTLALIVTPRPFPQINKSFLFSTLFWCHF